MIADRCEINRQIRADNKMLRELKAKVAKLAEAVEKSVPIIAEDVYKRQILNRVIQSSSIIKPFCII